MPRRRARCTANTKPFSVGESPSVASVMRGIRHDTCPSVTCRVELVPCLVCDLVEPGTVGCWSPPVLMVRQDDVQEREAKSRSLITLACSAVAAEFPWRLGYLILAFPILALPVHNLSFPLITSP